MLSKFCSYVDTRNNIKTIDAKNELHVKSP